MNKDHEVEISEIVSVLIEDAETIMDAFNDGVPEAKIIRNLFGPILRRWISDNDFFMVQKYLKPKIISFRYRNSPSCDKNLKKGIYQVLFGNISFNDFGISMKMGVSEDAKAKAVSPKGMQDVSTKASHYFRQPVCRLDGKTFKRSDIVKFSANELGGAHLQLYKNEKDKQRLIAFPVNLDHL